MEEKFVGIIKKIDKVFLKIFIFLETNSNSKRLFGNIAIDLTAIGVFLVFIKKDLEAQDGRLARMEIGAKLAGLKVRLQVNQKERKKEGKE